MLSKYLHACYSRAYLQNGVGVPPLLVRMRFITDTITTTNKTTTTTTSTTHNKTNNNNNNNNYNFNSIERCASGLHAWRAYYLTKNSLDVKLSL